MKSNCTCSPHWQASLFCLLALALPTSLTVGQESLRLGPGRTKKGSAAQAPLSPTQGKSIESGLQSAVGAKPLELERTAGETTAEAWERFFSARRKADHDSAFLASVRSTVRQLLQQQDFEQIQEVITAALRNHVVQPWMYEALALAMEASGAPEKDRERVILSTVDLNGDLEGALTTASYLASQNLDRAAVRLYRDIASQDPQRSEPYLQALKSAQSLNDAESIRWCCVGVLRQAWPSDQKEVEQYVRRVAEATIVELKKSGNEGEAAAFERELAGAMARDIRVRVWWTGDADIDLSVLEPSGEVCSYRNQRTAGGGLIQGDVFSRSSATAPPDGFSETFLCPEGFSGQYQVLLKRVWGEVAGGKVNVEVVTHLGSKSETTITRQLPLGKEGTLVHFDLNAGRRTEPLSVAKASTAATRQIEVARHVLAQQLSSSGSTLEGYHNRNAPFFVDPLGRLAFPMARGGVGFRPQLTTLQDGPMLTAGPAVVSADRRFVRMTLSPIFRTIGEVQTFNFATGSVGNGNGSGNTNTGTGGGAGGGTGGGTNGGGGGVGS